MVKQQTKSEVMSIIVSTFPSEQSIANIIKDLIATKKLCACVSLTKVRSVYQWNGKLEDQQEFIAFFKTTKMCAERLKDEIKKVHPYEVPEILEIKVDYVSESYLSWMMQNTATTTKSDTISRK